METKNIFSASELYEISKKQRPKLVEKVMEGVRDHIILRGTQYASSGDTSYSIYLKQTYKYVEDLLFGKCLELIKEFEDKGYKVSIDDCGDEHKLYFNFFLEW